MKKFKVGDNVICISSARPNEIGKVIAIRDESLDVQFEKGWGIIEPKYLRHTKRKLNFIDK